MTAPGRITTFIVDDEAPGRSRIRQFLKNEIEFEIAGEFGNGRDALEAIVRQRPDLVFLDVHMPGLNGLEVCQAILKTGGTLPTLIFVTAHDKYAVKAFEVHAVDYLLKPFDQERFDTALKRAREKIRAAQPQDSRLQQLLAEMLPAKQKPERMMIKEAGRFVFLSYAEIDWVEADGNYVRIHAGEKSHHIRDKLSAIEAQLPEGKFIRVSRSAIVNLDRIREMQPLFYGDYVLVLRNGSKLNLSRNYKAKLEALLGSASIE